MQLKDPWIILTWPKPNYVDPVTRGPELYIFNAIFFSITTSVVLTRFYARIFIRKWFGIDDWLILFAYILFIGDLAIGLYGYHNLYWDRHFWDRRDEYLMPGAKALYAFKLIWATASTALRVSVFMLYYRLLDHMELNRRKYRWVLHITVAASLSLYIAFFFASVFACIPVSQYWAWPSTGKCLDEGASVTSMSALNTFSEAWTAALPLFIIFKFNMSKKKRLSIISILCLGFLVAFVGMLRTIYAWTLYNTNDLTWWSTPYLICSEVEITLSMACASAPALRPVIGRFFSQCRDRKYLSKFKGLLKTGKFRIESLSSEQEELAKACYQFTNPISRMSSYSSNWRDVDLEGIGVDDNAYHVSLHGNNREWRDSVLQHTNGRESLEYPRRVLLKSINVVAKAWPDWMTGRDSSSSQQTVVDPDSEPIDVEKAMLAKQFDDMQICETRLEISPNLSPRPESFITTSSDYSREPPSRPISWGLPAFSPSTTDFRNHFRHSFFSGQSEENNYNLGRWL